jgi:hypothetical protein
MLHPPRGRLRRRFPELGPRRRLSGTLRFNLAFCIALLESFGDDGRVWIPYGLNLS